MAVVAASRLVFAVARDGVFPFSGWISKVSSDGQPRNAVTVMFAFAAALLCTILPSQVAFTSLISAGGVPTIAAYGLIPLLRLTMTPNHFRSSRFYLGKFAKPFYIAAVFFNAIVFAVRTLQKTTIVLPKVANHLSRLDRRVAVLLPCHRSNFQLRKYYHIALLFSVSPHLCRRV